MGEPNALAPLSLPDSGVLRCSILPDVFWNLDSDERWNLDSGRVGNLDSCGAEGEAGVETEAVSERGGNGERVPFKERCWLRREGGLFKGGRAPGPASSLG